MLTLFFVFLAGSSQAQVPEPPRAENYEFKTEFDYFSTTANFPSGSGSSQALPYGNKLVNMSGLGQASYDFDRQWRVYGGASYAYTDVKVYNLFTLTQNDQNSTGFNEGWLGLQWWYRKAGFSLVPQADFDFPFTRVNTQSTNALIGEGAMRMQLGSWLMYRVKGFTPFAYLGYAYRDQGRASLLPYSAGVNFHQRGMWWAQVEMRGFTSVTSDTNSPYSYLRTAYLYDTDGGSMAYYSINPSHTDLVLSAGWQFGDFTVYGGASISAFGQNSADGWTGTLGLSYHGSRGTPPARVRDRIEMPDEHYDESLFQENAAPPAAEAPPADAQQQQQQAPRKRRRPDPAPEPSVELLMKDTEKQLEKKSPRQ